MRLFCYLYYTTPQTVCQAGNAYLTKFYKYAIIVTRRTAKTVGGSNLPPEMEVSYMDVSTVITLLNLIINIIRLALYISKNKKK